MSERPRVLHLAPGGDLQGGAQRQLAYLAEGLARSRYEPLVLLPRDGDLRDALDRAGVQTQVVPYPLFSRGELLRLRHRLWTERRRAHVRVIDVARAYAPQLVHGDYAVAPYLNAIAAALGVPAVVHVRGSLARRRIRRLGLTRAGALIVIGDAYRGELVRHGVAPERVAVIADATDLERFRPRCDDAHRGSGDEGEVRFGIVGRIAPFKRQLDFLRAADELLRSGRRARFRLIGAPNPNRPLYVRRVRAFAARRLADRVTFTGPRRDMERVMPSLDVLVTLSGGSVMLEAMACAVPVITASARDPATLTIVRDGEAGRVVRAGDWSALVRVMAELCDDAEQRRRLGAAGRRRAEALFGRARLVEETVRLYDSLLGTGQVLRGAPESGNGSARPTSTSTPHTASASPPAR